MLLFYFSTSVLLLGARKSLGKKVVGQKLRCPWPPGPEELASGVGRSNNKNLSGDKKINGQNSKVYTKSW